MSSPIEVSARAGNAGNPADAEYDVNVRLEGRGDPLVYVPGMDGTGQLFYTQIPALARHFCVATYTLRDSAPDMPTLVSDLARVVGIAAPNGEPVVLVAESFGGALAMSFALRYPEKVRGLVVLNSFPHYRGQRRLRLAMRAIRLIPWGAMRIVRWLTASRLHSRHTRREEIRRFLRLTAQATRRGYLSRLGILTQYDIRARLADLRVPMLFLAADQDHLIPSVAQARFMSSRVPGAKMIVLQGHGHSCFLAQSIDLDAILAGWLPLHQGTGEKEQGTRATDWGTAEGNG